MPDTNDSWMAYIDPEVRAACLEKQWGFQIRRKWSVRDKPVSESPVDDYEWKLIPDERTELKEQPATNFDQGTYYVLSVDRPGGTFMLQHDTSHCGIMGPHWDRTTYTEIHAVRAFRGFTLEEMQRQIQWTTADYRLREPPPVGWLREHLVELTNQFQPNDFSIT